MRQLEVELAQGMIFEFERYRIMFDGKIQKKLISEQKKAE